MEYLKLAQAHEVETLRARLTERVAELDAQYEELREMRHDFDSALGTALSNFIKAELATKTSRVAALEREVRLLHEELRDTRAAHDERAVHRTGDLQTELAPLRVHIKSLEKGVHALTEERKHLATADPRARE